MALSEDRRRWVELLAKNMHAGSLVLIPTDHHWRVLVACMTSFPSEEEESIFLKVSGAGGEN